MKKKIGVMAITFVIAMGGFLTMTGCKNSAAPQAAPQEETQTQAPSTPDVKSDEVTPQANDSQSLDEMPKTCRPEPDFISKEEVKQSVLNKVPGATESDFTKFKLESDDRRYEYEGELIYDNMEYEFEINALTGEFLSWETESIYD